MSILDIVNGFDPKEVKEHYREIQNILDLKLNEGRAKEREDWQAKAEHAAKLAKENSELITSWAKENLAVGMTVKVTTGSYNKYRVVEALGKDSFRGQHLTESRTRDPQTRKIVRVFRRGDYITDHHYDKITAYIDDNGDEVRLLVELKK